METMNSNSLHQFWVLSSRPQVAHIHIGIQRPPDTVTPPRPGGAVLLLGGHIHLSAKQFATVQRFPGIRSFLDVLLTEHLVCGAAVVAFGGGGPGTGGEAATEPMLRMMSLVVVGEKLGSVDILTQVLALRPRHHLLVPGKQTVVPVAL